MYMSNRELFWWVFSLVAPVVVGVVIGVVICKWGWI